MANNFPKLHNAAWPGVVGKGEGSEPPIGLDTMLDLTAAAEVDGQKFDGVDLFLFDPHVSIDSACSPSEWAANPKLSTQRIADTFRKACDIAQQFGERLAAEGEICWGGMHSARRMVELLEAVDRPKTLGFQADMAHTLLFMMGHNGPDDRLVAADFRWGVMA